MPDPKPNQPTNPNPNNPSPFPPQNPPSQPAQMKSAKKKPAVEKKKRGPAPMAVDTSLLRDLAAHSLTQEECASILGCSVDTLQRHHLAVYRAGLQDCCASLRRKQFELAQAGNVTMLIWLGKNLLGQADKQEVTGKDGAPLIPKIDREEVIGKLLGSGKPAPAATIQ